MKGMTGGFTLSPSCEEYRQQNLHPMVEVAASLPGVRIWTASDGVG